MNVQANAIRTLVSAGIYVLYSTDDRYREDVLLCAEERLEKNKREG